MQVQPGMLDYSWVNLHFQYALTCKQEQWHLPSDTQASSAIVHLGYVAAVRKVLGRGTWVTRDWFWPIDSEMMEDLLELDDLSSSPKDSFLEEDLTAMEYLP